MKQIFKIILFLFLFYSFSYSKIINLEYLTTNEKTIVHFVVLNDSNKLITNLEKSNFQIFENGVAVPNFLFSTLEQPSSDDFSIIFLFDLSIGNIESNNKLLAIKILDTLIKSFPGSQKALLGFDFQNYLFCNFTRDNFKLISSLKFLNIFPSSGSNFDTALLSQNLGAIHLTKNSTPQKNIILLTDKNRDFDFNKVQELANQNDTKIFFLLINNDASNKLKDFTRKLNSYNFSIKSEEDIHEKIYILGFLFAGGKVSKIEWQNLPLCNQRRDVNISYKKNDTLRFETFVENSNLPLLVAYPPFLRYSSVIPSQHKDLELTLVARNFNIKIDSVQLQDSHFQIISGNIKNPIIIPKDSAHKFLIRFTPTDSSIVFDSLVIFSDACRISKVNITGGFPNKKPKERTLNLLSPKCGDYYFIGDTINIRWEGLLPTDVVQLQYSTDSGESWDTLAVNVLGLEYKFYLDPNLFKESDSCLIRVIQIWPNNAGETIELRHLSSINSANFNRDASLIITSTNHPEEYASIWNPGTGKKIFSLKGHTKQVNWACFDYQDRYAITASDDSTSILYDIKTGDSLFTFKAHKSKVTSANFSPDGNYVLTSGTDGNCFIWDINSKKIVHRLSTGINPIYFANFTPDSNYIAYASYDGNIYLYDIKQLKVVKSFITKFANNHIHHFSIHLGNKKLAAASHLGLIFIFNYLPEDTTSKTYPIFTLSHDTLSYPAINTSYFNSNGNWLITSGSDLKVARWNPFTGDLIDSIAIAEHSNSITSALFSFDDAMLLTSSWDSTSKIFNRTKLGLQIDTTDCYFSLKKIQVKPTDVNFRKVFLGQSKDSTFSPVIINNSSSKIEIDRISIIGTNKAEFSILSNIENLTLKPNDSLSLLLNFTPFDVGIRAAKLLFKFKGGATEVPLSGEGFIPQLIISPNSVDIGQVEVGEFKDSLVLYNIQNLSTKEIRLLSIRNIGPDSLFFSIIDGGETTTIKPKGTHPLTIRFTPDTLGKRNTIIEFTTDLEIPKSYMNILGEGIYPTYDSITITVGNFEAKPGDLITIPIILKNKRFVNYASYYNGLGFDFTFNKTILEPLDKQFQSYFNNDFRTLKIIAEKEVLNDSILIELKFRVGLGNDSITPLIVANGYPLGKGKIVIKEESGKLFLKDLCKEGGIRLFEPDGKIELGPIQPNPTEGLTRISFETIETGKTKIELYNSSGDLRKVLVDKTLNPGKYFLSFDANELETGIYLLILRTPNNIITKMLQVIK